MLRAISSTIVLKFGSSVLRTASSLPVAVAEIYRHYRDGKQVVAVVSAFEQVTDELCSQARMFSEEPEVGTLAALLSIGEITSGTQLTLALHRAGIPAEFVDPRDIGLTATGERDNATLSGHDLKELQARLTRAAVLIVPGFFAKSPGGGLAHLGRGGSDFTALYLANTLRAPCHLLKDVDGLYEADPALSERPPRRFLMATYAAAETHAGPLIQPKAIRFIREHGVVLDVGKVGSSLRTRIGEGPAILSAAPPPRRIQIALLGLGTVGGGVLEYLELFPERFEVVAILVRAIGKHVARGISPDILTDQPTEVFSRHPDILIEALPGLEPARACLDQALKRLLRVVTANKALLAADWEALAPRLAGRRRQIRYSAAVGGSVPMLEAIERLSLRSRIVRLRGVLNGTTNFVLDRLGSGDLLVNAVRRAQAQGLAEADPAEDLSGRDTARKIAVLGRVAFGGTPNCVELFGVDESAHVTPGDLSGSRVRLVAEAERTPTGFSYRVAPRALALTDSLADTRGAGNRLEVTTESGDIFPWHGIGAGRVPTATAVVADLLEHVRVMEEEALGTVPVEFQEAREEGARAGGR
jgi:homoserine dehydrogenase